MTRLADLARELGTSGRTLRRYVAGGVVRAERPSPRRVEISPVERDYLLTHWTLLADLMEALRTERNVRTAVFYGALADGPATPRSAVHLAVLLDRDGARSRHGLTARLEHRIGRRVDVSSLASPATLAVARDGRVLVDRDGELSRPDPAE